jgi:hypothetical protein
VQLILQMAGRCEIQSARDFGVEQGSGDPVQGFAKPRRRTRRDEPLPAADGPIQRNDLVGAPSLELRGKAQLNRMGKGRMTTHEGTVGRNTGLL